MSTNGTKYENDKLQNHIAKAKRTAQISDKWVITKIVQM